MLIKKTIFLFLLVTSIIYIGWIGIFNDQLLMRGLLASVLPIIVGSLSFVWLYKAFRHTLNKQRYFWLMLSIGVLFFIVSNATWVHTQITEGADAYTKLSFLFWLLAYFFYLIAMFYKTTVIQTSIANGSYVFTFFVFMAFGTSITLHYFSKTVLVATDYSFPVTAITLAYPLISLGIMYVMSCLLYLSRYSREKKVIGMIFLAFLFQVTADFYYLFQILHDTYQPGSLVDYIWLVSLFVLGLTGKVSAQLDNKKIEREYVKKEKQTYFPYIAVLIQIILVVQEYLWQLNALSAGLIITFLMILGRQLYILQKNKKLVYQYRHLAYHDTLTGMKNRTSFINELNDVMDHAKETNRPVALLLMDLDRFKNVNDTLGHYVGDRILQAASERLNKYLPNDYLMKYRIGGDEFVIVLPDITQDECEKSAQSILDIFSKPFIIDHHEITITPSIGISMYPYNGKNSEILLKYADAAMYLAKEKGKNRYQFFNTELNDVVNRRMTLEVELRKAMELQQVSLHYQPKFSLKENRLVGMEALLRWDHPVLGSVSPAEFIPIAEETGQINAIGEWVIKTACKQNKIWYDQGHRLCVSVNVSARQLEQFDFVRMVKSALLETGLSPAYLELEITESIMQNTTESTEVLQSIKEYGVKTSLDDFGTGYSSLYILKELPIDAIKIDKSFIDNMEDATNLSIIKTIIDIGLNLNLQVVAEGIEHAYQIEYLRGFNCGYGQGYFFSEPVPADKFEEKLKLDLLLKQ
ncbi:EAL domain-containing protein [Aquibacillus koreensis]|uniref:EAL domain-containing protein n=1 Tax=Aquibacillus koreensis TaxID=279446 RepID=A0A9X4AIE8_9BACI|nr:EAL domain-containing protein [Aquibacillus koreensis]MCT2535228.1 EAL domain-containing protein [Aquibacillus koreensis]MDC3421087.1 EAL domain-containing protein [Aquibacillus koreensis]